MSGQGVIANWRLVADGFAIDFDVCLSVVAWSSG
jgi:hypothetical protein